jgi:hypothetical protein
VDVAVSSSRLYIPAHGRLDPITAYFINYEEKGKGRVIVQCYARAWTSYWGGMGDRTVYQFFKQEPTEYLVESLQWGLNDSVSRTRQAKDAKYLAQIVDAIKAAL